MHLPSKCQLNIQCDPQLPQCEWVQLVSKLMSGGPMVAAFESNKAAQERLMGALLTAFDQRSWVAISTLLLRLTRGYGLGQVDTQLCIRQWHLLNV